MGFVFQRDSYMSSACHIIREFYQWMFNASISYHLFIFINNNNFLDMIRRIYWRVKYSLFKFTILSMNSAHLIISLYFGTRPHGCTCGQVVKGVDIHFTTWAGTRPICLFTLSSLNHHFHFPHWTKLQKIKNANKQRWFDPVTLYFYDIRTLSQIISIFNLWIRTLPYWI